MGKKRGFRGALLHPKVQRADRMLRCRLSMSPVPVGVSKEEQDPTEGWEKE